MIKMNPFILTPGTPVSDVQSILADQYDLRLKKASDGTFTTEWLDRKPARFPRIDNHRFRQEVMRSIGARDVPAPPVATGPSTTRAVAPSAAAIKSNPPTKTPVSKAASKRISPRKKATSAPVAIKLAPIKELKVALLDAVSRLKADGVPNDEIPNEIEDFITATQRKPMTKAQTRDVATALKEILIITDPNVHDARVVEPVDIAPPTVQPVPTKTTEESREELGNQFDSLTDPQKREFLQMFPGMLDAERAANAVVTLIRGDPSSVMNTDIKYIGKPSRFIRMPMRV